MDCQASGGFPYPAWRAIRGPSQARRKWMSKISEPSTTLLLLSDLALAGKTPNLTALRKRLKELMPSEAFKIDPMAGSTVELTIPARNSWERDRVKGLVNSSVDGWKVIEPQSYSLPKSL